MVDFELRKHDFKTSSFFEVIQARKNHKYYHRYLCNHDLYNTSYLTSNNLSTNIHACSYARISPIILCITTQLRLFDKIIDIKKLNILFEAIASINHHSRREVKKIRTIKRAIPYITSNLIFCFTVGLFKISGSPTFNINRPFYYYIRYNEKTSFISLFEGRINVSEV